LHLPCVTADPLQPLKRVVREANREMPRSAGLINSAPSSLRNEAQKRVGGDAGEM
jgi:hypothetical protein